MERNQCPQCQKRLVAINYYRNNRTHYRSLCTPCIHKNKQKQVKVPSWVRSGYKKALKCDRCGFKFKLADQSSVYYVDGNIDNNNWLNLKTICANCRIEVAKSRWRPSNLTADF
jgi:Zn ribbon nucleic-acid-binding protein